MSDAPDKPPNVWLLAHEVADNERECKARHERSASLGNEALAIAGDARDALIELTGRSGKNGVVGTMRADILQLQQDRDERRKEERAFLVKIVFASVGSGGFVAGALQLIQFLS